MPKFNDLKDFKVKKLILQARLCQRASRISS